MKKVLLTITLLITMIAFGSIYLDSNKETTCILNKNENIVLIYNNQKIEKIIFNNQSEEAKEISAEELSVFQSMFTSFYQTDGVEIDIHLAEDNAKMLIYQFTVTINDYDFFYDPLELNELLDRNNLSLNAVKKQLEANKYQCN